jgi:hypothetical protein
LYAVTVHQRHDSRKAKACLEEQACNGDPLLFRLRKGAEIRQEDLFPCAQSSYSVLYLHLSSIMATFCPGYILDSVCGETFQESEKSRPKPVHLAFQP